VLEICFNICEELGQVHAASVLEVVLLMAPPFWGIAANHVSELHYCSPFKVHASAPQGVVRQARLVALPQRGGSVIYED
jgi:hypothetical protein